MKNMNVLKRFLKTRRSAIAVTMAIALVPLVLLIGIAVDVTFLSQDRLQTAFASQAAAVSATRVAASTYAQEIAVNGVSPKLESSQTAALQAINSADVEGDLWFRANLGNYSIGSLNSDSPVVTYDGATTGAANAASPPNFTAQVTATSTYPPIFNSIFGQPAAQKWVYSTGGTAKTQFSYAEILLLLDTSQSMMIGADPSDIATLEDNSVCPQYNWLQSTDPGAGIPAQSAITDNKYDYSPSDGDQLNFANFTQYNQTAKNCSPLNGQNYGISPSYVDGSLTGNTAETACALACHFSTKKTSDGYYADLYGMARREGVNLRIDILFEATEEVIEDMQDSQAASLGQLAVGVYQFNTDIGALVNGSTGTGGQTPEASSDLATALQKVEAVDYKKTPSETTIPQLTNASTVFKSDLSQAYDGDTTNLKKSMTDFLAGNAFPTGTSGGAQTLSASGTGNTAASPVKYVFIVTDGMEDENPQNGGGENGQDTAGQMTSVAGEAAGTGTCSALKKMGFTVYVLYVQYYPLAEHAYYDPLSSIGRIPTPDTLADNKSLTDPSVQALSDEPADAQTPTSPTALALQSCASAPADFESASNSNEIQGDLTAMLKSALASAIRLTN